MNKIVLYFGLLIFFLSIIFFSQKGLLIEDVLLRSFGIFLVITVMSSILALAFVKAINKTALDKENELKDNIIGSDENE